MPQELTPRLRLSQPLQRLTTLLSAHSLPQPQSQLPARPQLLCPSHHLRRPASTLHHLLPPAPLPQPRPLRPTADLLEAQVTNGLLPTPHTPALEDARVPLMFWLMSLSSPHLASRLSVSTALTAPVSSTS